MQEWRSDPDTREPAAPPEECCNGSACNPLLLQDIFTAAPLVPKVLHKPAPKSKGGIALRLLSAWCREQAEELLGTEELLAKAPSAYFLPSHLQWAIAAVFNNQKFESAADFPIRTVDDLRTMVPLEQWRFSSQYEQSLLAFLRQQVDGILAEWKSNRKKAHNSNIEESTTASNSSCLDDDTLTIEERQAKVVERQTQLDNQNALLVTLHQRQLEQLQGGQSTNSIGNLSVSTLPDSLLPSPVNKPSSTASMPPNSSIASDSKEDCEGDNSATESGQPEARVGSDIQSPLKSSWSQESHFHEDPRTDIDTPATPPQPVTPRNGSSKKRSLNTPGSGRLGSRCKNQQSGGS